MMVGDISIAPADIRCQIQSIAPAANSSGSAKKK
jgi:hypothetical protein